MLNDRDYINKLKSNIGDLEIDKKCLLEDLFEKEANIMYLQKASKELSIENEELKKRINMLEEVINRHEENVCKLNVLLCIESGRVEKLSNYIKMTTDTDLLVEDNREIKRIIRRVKESE